MKLRFSMAAICILLVGGLAGCGDKPSIVGTWQAITANGRSVAKAYDTVQFFKDGTVSDQGTCPGCNGAGTYKIVDDTHLLITTPLQSEVVVYHLNGDQLTTTTNGQTEVFQRTG